MVKSSTPHMEFFCFHRDRAGSMQLRGQLVEEHWSYMDRYAASMIARGPTYDDDGTLTGSVHILELPDPTAARTFAFEEPNYQAGAYRDVLLRRWQNSLGRTRWGSDLAPGDGHGFLVLGFTDPRTFEPGDVLTGDELLAGGPLLSDDGSALLGLAVLLEAPDADRARQVVPADRFTGIEVHRWRRGGRPG